MLNGLHSRERSTMVKMVKMDKIQLSRDHHVSDHFRKSPYFSEMQDTTRNTIQNRFSIPVPSSEKPLAEIFPLKKLTL